MAKYTVDLLTAFVDNFEAEIHFKNKIEASHYSQVGKIGLQLENYLHQSGIELKPTKLSIGSNPTAHIKFRRKLSDSVLSEILMEFFRVHKIDFKKHQHPGSLPLFTIRNDTVPELLEGVGHSLFSIYAPSPNSYLSIKLEVLDPNQIVKILDSKLENLSLLIWNGGSLKKFTFGFTRDTSAELDTEILDLELISESKLNPIRIRANFTKSSLLGYTLEKILEIQKI